jgi:hypothetical protein
MAAKAATHGESQLAIWLDQAALWKRTSFHV